MTEITEIDANSRDRLRQLAKDLWRYRELLLTFVERDLKVRYKQTLIGVAWVILQPLVNSLIFVIVLSRMAKMPTQDLPPLLFFMAAFVPWTCFANGVAQAAASLENNANLIGKVYFPRLIVPGAAVLATLADFLISWTLFILVVAAWKTLPGHLAGNPWTWRLLPFTLLLLFIQIVAAFGIGTALAVLNAQYRDIRYALPFLLQTAMWLSPVAWPAQRLVESRLGPVGLFAVYANPMAGVIETYRALLAGTSPPYGLLGIHTAIAIGLCLFGVMFFNKRIYRIVDIL